MTDYVEVTTQAELDRVKPGDVAVVRSGRFFSGSATVRAYDSATVQASGSATVRAYDSATVQASGSATVRAYDSATVRASGSATVRAYDSATVEAYGSATVQAYDSATVQASGSATVRAYGSATVRAYGSATVEASKHVAIHRFGTTPTVRGGVLIQAPDTNTCSGAEWADYYGIDVSRAGYGVVYAAVDDGYVKGHAYTPTRYKPGDKPKAADWDAGRFCGGGLHFGPRPMIARRYNTAAARYVACRVKVADIVPLGDKIKAPSCVVLREVDIDGEALS